MRFNKFDLNLLVALDALLTERNTTRAAEKVHITQSAMSNALNRLREYFEDELLVRVGQRMELTPRGQALREPVRDLLLRFDASIAARPQFDCRRSDREFKLLLSDYSMTMLIPLVLAEAARQGSTVRFRLLPQVSTPARALERGEADLLVIPHAMCSAEHPTEIVLREDFVCVVWSESVAAREGMSLDRYAAAGHVVMVPHGTDDPAFEGRELKDQGFSRRVEVTAFNFTALPFLVMGTERVATVQTRVAHSFAPALPIKILPLPIPVPALEQAIQWHKFHTSDPGICWLRDLMRTAGARLNGTTCAQLTG